MFHHIVWCIILLSFFYSLAGYHSLLHCIIILFSLSQGTIQQMKTQMKSQHYFKNKSMFELTLLTYISSHCIVSWTVYHVVLYCIMYNFIIMFFNSLAGYHNMFELTLLSIYCIVLYSIVDCISCCIILYDV